MALVRPQGFVVARCTVECLMRSLGCKALCAGRKCRTTIAHYSAGRPLDPIKRQFQASRPSQLWVAAGTGRAAISGRRRRFLRQRARPETIIGRIGLYKTAVIRRREPWRHLHAVEYATFEWVDWFNHRRPLESIRNVPSAELEASYYHSTGQLPMAA
jgi:transposase InsO family protein